MILLSHYGLEIAHKIFNMIWIDIFDLISYYENKIIKSNYLNKFIFLYYFYFYYYKINKYWKKNY